MSDGKIMLNGIVYGGGTEINDNAVANDATWSSSQIVSMLPTDTASGAVANFPDGADDVPIKSLTAQIVATQEGSGDPSPSNPRAISGWSAVTISHSGADTSDPTEFTIPLGQTVYDGELDVTNGALTNNCLKVTMGSLSWTKSTTYGAVFFADLVGGKSGIGKYICEVFDYDGSCAGITDAYNRGNLKFANATLPNGDIRIYFRCDAFESETANTFSNTFNSNLLIYELATPVEIALTPEEINTLYGENNIWADTGDVTVEYRADVQKYIDKKIAEAVGNNRSVSLSKAPEEVKEEKSEEKEEKTEEKEQEGDENVDR